jgi:hypothetical protein
VLHSSCSFFTVVHLFSQFRTEAETEKLWIPADSVVLSNKAWKTKHFEETTRLQQMMLVHEEDALTPESMLKVGAAGVARGRRHLVRYSSM